MLKKSNLIGRGLRSLLKWVILNGNSRKNRPFPHYAPVNKQRNQNETRVDNFIQITVFRPPEPRVGAFVYRNAGKVYCPHFSFYVFYGFIIAYVKCFSSQDICRLFTAPFSRKIVQIERFALRTGILNDCHICLGYIKNYQTEMATCTGQRSILAILRNNRDL